jgi:hypothetical protein
VSSPSPADELVEEVDEDGVVLRVVTRAQMRAEKLRHRCTYIGVVSADGSSLLAHQLAEELGVTGVPLVDAGGGVWSGGGVSTVGRVFVARTDGPFSFADGEVVQARFLTWPELDDLVARERVCPDSLELALPLVRAAVQP